MKLEVDFCEVSDDDKSLCGEARCVSLEVENG